MKCYVAIGLLGLPLLCLAAETRPEATQNAIKPSKPPVFQSSFANYRAFKDEPVGIWRDINEAARKAGGWRVYAREISQTANPDERPASPSEGMK